MKILSHNTIDDMFVEFEQFLKEKKVEEIKAEFSRSLFDELLLLIEKVNQEKEEKLKKVELNDIDDIVDWNSDTIKSDWVIFLNVLIEYLSIKNLYDDVIIYHDQKSNNIASKFIEWMKISKKENEDDYSINTIKTYTKALESATKNLDVGDLDFSTNLFNYSDPQIFSKVYEKLTKLENFDHVDKSFSNGSFSSAAKKYQEFLETLDMIDSWIFQANPKFYRIEDAIRENETIRFPVNQSYKLIGKGHTIYIWKSGRNSGIIAKGIALSNPIEQSFNFKDDPYLVEGLRDFSRYIDIKIEDKFVDSPISKSRLIEDARTERMSVITFPGQTNTKIDFVEKSVIDSMISNNYSKIEVKRKQHKKRYWVYSAGAKAEYWEQNFKDREMRIGWDFVGDLLGYESEKSLSLILNHDGKNHSNARKALWQFSKEIQIGDIVYVKRGESTIVGRGIVKSGYQFNNKYDKLKHKREVSWTSREETKVVNLKIKKVLTEITEKEGEIKLLEDFYEVELEDDSDLSLNISRDIYDDVMFLDDVYISEDELKSLKALIHRKKNLILQGPPGVGKTYISKRLAFAIMGEKNESRILSLQFHQSYSYEDFVMGIRPSVNGFVIKPGPFYEFCNKAREDNQNEYFMIIDEINRGNISRIFGELLVLIEEDKREKDSVKLLYQDELFSVPENLYIIGMMNTADRGLALIDYALRRRFAFFDILPAFSHQGFKNRILNLNNRKISEVIGKIEAINADISGDLNLGEGFCIGHSYFCTNFEDNELWLSSIVNFEIIPTLKEYWSDDKKKFEHWEKELKESLSDKTNY